MRKAKPRKRIILPDPKYNDVLVTKFVNNIMLKGKKTIAYNIFYDAIDIVSERSNENGLEVWKKALANVTKRQWLFVWLLRYWQHTRKKAQHLRRKRIFTEWLKPTRHSRILDSKH